MKCRFCHSQVEHSFCDLGKMPFSNAYVPMEKSLIKEESYPLHAFVCSSCLLVQLEEFETPAQIFGDYAYFSSFSHTWLKHAETYVNEVTARLNLDSTHQVIEIASNDGYLLQFFKQKKIPILGIEPARNVAQVAQDKGIPTVVEFFGVQTATELVKKGIQADLLIGNNVLAHVPDLNDFVRGLKIILKPEGRITLEFPHLLKLMEENQFDTIYHEHFSYFSYSILEKIFSAHALAIVDVEEIPTHGGSLRVHLQHQENSSARNIEQLDKIRKKESDMGLNSIQTYTQFNNSAKELRSQLVHLLAALKKQGKHVMGYGAPAKGNTLLNYCGISVDMIPQTVDISPYKQGHYLPGSRIPIFSPEKIEELKPDYLLILPWNLKEEIMEQMSFIRKWGGKFIIPIPTVEICK